MRVTFDSAALWLSEAIRISLLPEVKVLPANPPRTTLKLPDVRNWAATFPTATFSSPDPRRERAADPMAVLAPPDALEASA